MVGIKSETARAVLYAIGLVFGAMIAIPDPTMMLNLLAAICYLPVVGYALRDGSLRALGWGIAALYAYGIVVSLAFWTVRDRLLDAGRHGDAALGIAVLSIAVLVGTYLAARRRRIGGELSLAQYR